jgi:hypothetical protein
VEQHSDKKEEYSHHGLLVRRLPRRNDFTRFAKRFLEINWVNTVSCYGLILVWGGGFSLTMLLYLKRKCIELIGRSNQSGSFLNTS